MQNYKKPLLLFFPLLTPLLCFASGGYVLEALFIDFIVFISLIVFSFNIKIKLKGKLIIWLVYIISFFLLTKCIDQVNYLNNLTLINWASAVVPTISILITYFIVRKSFKLDDVSPSSNK